MNACCARALLESHRRASCALLATVLLASSAQAGHAPLVPEPRTILLRDDDAAHIVIGSRQGGYFVTRDAGATWSWMCEAGIGYEDEEVYPGALLTGGTLVVSTGFGGVAVSRDGCGFTPWLPSEQPFVADVRARADSAGVVALEARGDGAAFVNRLWQSSDGSSWEPLGAPFAPDALAASFAISNEGELFVGVTGPAGAELLRSADAARSWARVSITSEAGVTPRIVGAHGPSGSARVFVVADHAQADGLTTPGDRALISVDGGVTFTTQLQALGDLAAFSLSRDGARLAVGGHTDGLHVLLDAESATAQSRLEQVSTNPVHSLAWDGRGQLYAAGHEVIDGFSVGVSSDGGRKFQSVFALCQVQGPLVCPADSTVGAACHGSGETGWDVRKEVADTKACTAGSEPDGNPAPSDGTGNDGAVVEAGSAGSGNTRASTRPDAAARDSSPDGSGGCTLATRSANSPLSSGLLVLLAAAVLRRRRERARASSASCALPQSLR